jgi:hypothetical protein
MAVEKILHPVLYNVAIVESGSENKDLELCEKNAAKKS